MNTLNKEATIVPVQFYAHRWWAFVVLSFSLLVISLDNTILNVALPTLARDLTATTSQLQWMVDAYTLVFAGLLLTMGSLSDRFGRKRALMLGLLVFGAGSVWCAFSGSADVLIAARALMGIGGALIMPSTLSITTNMFSEKERTKAIGAWGGVGALGIIVGPLAGGWLLAHFAWGAVFLINAPFVLVTLVGSFFIVPESKDPQQSRLDPLGVVLSIVGLTALIYGIIEVPTYGWSDGSVLGAFAVAVVMMVSFVIWERHTPTPMLDIKLFRNPRFSAASLALTMGSFSMFGSLFFLTLYLQFVLNYTALEAGVRLVPLALAFMVSALLSVRLIEFIGVKITTTAGLVTVAGGLVLLAQVSVSSGYGLIIAALIVIGLGIGMAMIPATTSIMNALPLERAGVGSAVNDTTRQVGGALGVAVLGSVLASVYRAAIDDTSSLRILPLQVRDMVRDSIGKAVVVASHMPGLSGHVIRVAANAALIEAISRTVLIGAGVTLFGALIAFLFLPSHAKKELGRNLTGEEETGTIEDKKELDAAI